MKIQISKKLSWIICGLGWMMAIISIFLGKTGKSIYVRVSSMELIMFTKLRKIRSDYRCGIQTLQIPISYRRLLSQARTCGEV